MDDSIHAAVVAADMEVVVAAAVACVALVDSFASVDDADVAVVQSPYPVEVVLMTSSCLVQVHHYQQQQ